MSRHQFGWCKPEILHSTPPHPPTPAVMISNQGGPYIICNICCYTHQHKLIIHTICVVKFENVNKHTIIYCYAINNYDFI